MFAEEPEREPGILHDTAGGHREAVPPPEVAALFPALLNRTHGPDRRAPRLVGPEAGLQLLVHLAMEVVHRAPRSAPGPPGGGEWRHAPQRRRESATVASGPPQTARTMAEIAEESRSQLAASAGDSLQADPRERVVFGAAVGLRGLPLGFDLSVALELVQRGIQGALADL